MAKRTHNAVSTAALRTVKTSLVIDAHLHSRLSALASLRGCTINALLVEAARNVAREISVIDRRKPASLGVTPDDGDPSGEGIGGEVAA